MERIWNYVYYTIFNLYRLLYKFSNYIDPFRLFYKIPKIKKFYAKGGIEDMSKFTEDIVVNNKKYGMNIMIAGIHIGGLLVLLQYGLFNLLQIAIGKSLIQNVWSSGNLYKLFFILSFLILPWIINENFLFKNDKYLKYFEEFDKESKEIKNKWQWISFAIIFGIFTFFILSFIILVKTL